MKLRTPYFSIFFILLLQLLGGVVIAQDFTGLSYEELEGEKKKFYQKGDYSSAAACIAESLAKAEVEFGNKDSVYIAYMVDLGYLYTLSAHYYEAEPLFLEALESLELTLGVTEPLYATALNYLGDLYKKTTKYEEAESIYLKSKAVRRKVLTQKTTSSKAQIDYAVSLNSLGDLYRIMDKDEQAEPLLLEAIEIIKDVLGHNHPQYSKIMNNLATLYADMEIYPGAESLYLKVLGLTSNSLGTKHPFYAELLSNLADLYTKTERMTNAEPLYLEALAINKNSLGEGHPTYSKSLNNIAFFYKEIDDYERAEPLFLEAKAIDEKVLSKNNPSYINTLTNLASLYRKMNKLDTAFTYCMTSIAYNFESFDSIFPGIFSGDLDADIDVSPHDLKKVKSTSYLQFSQLKYRSSFQLNKSIRALMKILKAQYRLIPKTDKKYFVKLHQYYNLCRAAIQIHDQIRNGFSGRQNKLRVLKKNGFFVKSAISASLQLDEAIHYAEAFSYAEQNKSVLLADAVKGERARVFGDLPDSLVLLENSLQQQMDDLKRKKYQTQDDSVKLVILGQENQLNEKIERFLKSLKDKYPQYHALKYQNITANVADVQALLDDKSLLLEYFVTKKVTYLFAISKNAVELFPITIPKKEIEFKIQPFRYALSDYKLITEEPENAYSLYTKNAFWFYENIIAVALETSDSLGEGAGKRKNIKNLIIVADDELGHLPFEAFLVEEAPDSSGDYKELHYLVNDYNISYNYSATIWKENLAIPLNQGSRNNNQILACASVYSKADSSLLHLRLPHIFNLRTLMKPLPSAQEEVSIISQTFKGVFLQGLASNERYFKENANEFGIIHLAMHGLLHRNVPMFSSLAFSEDRDTLEDNFLQAYEISRLKLNADLVVLSACETGYGKFEQGEGIISLARSFMYAGIPSLVVSLWPVSDKSTAVIMKCFYQNLVEGLPKDEGLRRAKLHYIEEANNFDAHPAFWSPFIQLGDSRPIDVATRKPWIWWLGSGAVLLILIFIAAKRRT